LLALLDSFAPSCTPRQGEIDDVAALFGFAGGELDLLPDELRRLDPEARLVMVLQRAHELNVIPREFGVAEARRFLELQKRLHASLASYRPRQYGGTVQLFRCRDEIHPELLRITDPQLGWREFVRGEIEMHWVSGDHHKMVYGPYVKEVAAKLRECLARAHSNAPWP
jgi:thioesterase domain-containing protein